MTFNAWLLFATNNWARGDGAEQRWGQFLMNQLREHGRQDMFDHVTGSDVDVWEETGHSEKLERFFDELERVWPVKDATKLS